MNTFFKVLAWIGAVFVSLEIILSFKWSWAYSHYTPSKFPTMGAGMLWLVIVPLAIIGLLFILLGGIIGKPRYFWVISIILGLLHIISEYGSFWVFTIGSPKTDPLLFIFSFMFVPGLILIFGGFFLKVAAKRNQKVG